MIERLQGCLMLMAIPLMFFVGIAISWITTWVCGKWMPGTGGWLSPIYCIVMGVGILIGTLIAAVFSVSI